MNIKKIYEEKLKEWTISDEEYINLMKKALCGDKESRDKIADISNGNIVWGDN